MFAEKIDAVELHKFIKENIDETVKSVALRPALSKKTNKLTALIYTQTDNGKEANYVVYDDKSFTISTSNNSLSEKISELTPMDIRFLWQKFLREKFGVNYRNFLYPTEESEYILL